MNSDNCYRPSGEPDKENVTNLLRDWQKGNRDAGERLMTIVHMELKKISQAYLKRESEHATLQSTELVNEAFIRLIKQKDIEYQDRIHFFGVAAKLMRQILIENLRKKSALKRGGASRELALDEAIGISKKRSLNLVRLDEALIELETIDPRKSRLVELRFFAGLTIEETALVLNISPATLKREWLLAKAWLHRHISGQ